MNTSFRVSLWVAVLSFFLLAPVKAIQADDANGLTLNCKLADRSDGVDTVTLTFDLAVQNSLPGPVSGVSVSIVSPVTLDETYGQAYIGDILGGDNATVSQVTFDVPASVQSVFDAKLKYMFKLDYVDDQAQSRTQMEWVTPENL